MSCGHLAAGASEFWAALCPVSEYVMQHVCSSTSMGHAILDASFGGWQPWELDIKGPMSPPPLLSSVGSSIPPTLLWSWSSWDKRRSTPWGVFTARAVMQLSIAQPPLLYRSISLERQDKLVDRNHHDAANSTRRKGG